MSLNTKHILKAICDAALPLDDLIVTESFSNIALPIYEKMREQIEDIVLTLYTSVVDDAVRSINMRLKPERLFLRIVKVLRKKHDRVWDRLSEHLVLYWTVCRIISSLQVWDAKSIEYLPFDL